MVLIAPQYPVSLFRLFWKMGGWIVIIIGVFLLALTLISALSLNTAKRFEREGRGATATVTEKYTTESRDSDGDRTVTYWLTFEYTTLMGEEITLNRSAGTSEYRRAGVGAPFELQYLASEPRRTELTQGSFRTGAKVAQIGALVAGIVWLTALWIMGGWAVSAVRARRYGAREEAQVMQVRQTWFKVNKQPRFRIVWRDMQGREGQSLMHKGADVGGLRPGDTVGIYQGVKRAWWVGDVGERVPPGQ